MSETAPTTLVSPDGQRYDVPSSGVEQLKAKGFRALTDSERKDAELQSKYGEGVLPAIGAAASGAASGLTFGGSDALLAQTPLAEANREISERNPEAHTAGQIASVAVPLAGELAGASLAGKAARAAGSAITGVGKAATLGGEAAGGIAKAVGMGGAAPLVRGAVQAGAEGAAFQIGNNIGEASRRDIPLDAETLLAHVGEAGVLGAGVGAVVPAAGKVVRWTADKSVAGLERGVQGLRALGIGIADRGVDAIEAGAGAVSRNADAIGQGIESGVKGVASGLDSGAQAIVNNADNIGAAAQGAGEKIAGAVDDHLLPRIRAGLTAQTERPDIINDVFASGPEGRALRKELGPQTITGTREVQTEALSRPLNDIWEQSLQNGPMFDDMAIAAKRDLQSSELAAAPLGTEAHNAVAQSVRKEAAQTLEALGKYNGTAQTYFGDALIDYTKTVGKHPTSESLYLGLDGLKTATDKIAKFAKGAELGDTGAAFAAEEARRFRSFAKQKLEDPKIWGEAGQIQQEVNAAYSKYKSAFAQFEKQFAAVKAKGQSARVLDGAKIKKWASDITGPAGQVRNVVVDDLVQAQTELVQLTEKLGQRNQIAARNTLGSATAGDAARARAQAIEAAPEGMADVLNRSAGNVRDLAGAKTTATQAIDRAEVLQQTQSAILSRQGAGVNPLPVEALKGIGGGALLGGIVGGAPGAIAGGALTSVLQKYGAITSNPKSAIQFLNTIDRLRGIDKDSVASWIKATLGETENQGIRAGLNRVAAGVDGKAIGASIKRGADAVGGAVPGMREALSTASQSTAKHILAVRGGAERGIEAIASRADTASTGVMQRILPAVSYADVTNSSPDAWWKKTQKAITNGQANPQALHERLDKDLAGIADTLPDMAKAISRQQMAVFGYLADKMPRNPRPYMLGDQSWTPDQGEMKSYRDLVLVATKPDALLPLITIGTATRAQVEAVKQLWPKKYEETRSQVVNAVMTAAADGHPVPYEARLRLGQLLGTPLDASQEPGFANWIQAASQPAAPPDAPAPAQGGNAPMKFDIKPDNNLPLSIKAAERK